MGMGRGGVEGLEVRRCERRGMSVRCFSIVPCILGETGDLAEFRWAFYLGKQPSL